MAPAPHARLQMIGSRETEPGSTYLRPPTSGPGPADPATEEAIVSVTINWAQCHTRPVLMIPGPTELPFPVIQAMNQPPSIQYDRSFDEAVLEPTTLALRDVFQTKNEVIMMPGSGRTALEAGARSGLQPHGPALRGGARPLRGRPRRRMLPGA